MLATNMTLKSGNKISIYHYYRICILKKKMGGGGGGGGGGGKTPF